MKNTHLTADIAKTISKISKRKETKLDKIYNLIIDMSKSGYKELSYHVNKEGNEFIKLKKGQVKFNLTKKESEILIKNGFKLNRNEHDIKHGNGCDNEREIHW